VKGLETVWEVDLAVLSVLCTRALNLAVTFDLLLNCLLVFLSHIVPPWGRSCPSVLCIAPVVFLTALCGKFCCQLVALPICGQRGRRAGNAQVETSCDEPSIDACSRFLNDPILTGCASVASHIASHLAEASGTILGWGACEGLAWFC
jgi:hypothetical protein